MNNVINMSEYCNTWNKVVDFNSSNSTLQVYVCSKTGDVDIVQVDNDDVAINTRLDKITCNKIVEALSKIKR